MLRTWRQITSLCLLLTICCYNGSILFLFYRYSMMKDGGRGTTLSVKRTNLPFSAAISRTRDEAHFTFTGRLSPSITTRSILLDLQTTSALVGSLTTSFPILSMCRSCSISTTTGVGHARRLPKSGRGWRTWVWWLVLAGCLGDNWLNCGFFTRFLGFVKCWHCNSKRSYLCQWSGGSVLQGPHSS